MRNVKRRNVRKQSGEWGVVETRSKQGFGHHTEVWLAYWMELGKPGRVSIEIDPDRAANIAPPPGDFADDDLDLVPFPIPRARC